MEREQRLLQNLYSMAWAIIAPPPLVSEKPDPNDYFSNVAQYFCLVNEIKSYLFQETLTLLFLWLSSSWKVLCWHLPETQLMSYCTISLKILAQCAKMNFMRIEAFVHWLDSQYRTSYCIEDENDIQKVITTNLGGFIKWRKKKNSLK